MVYVSGKMIDEMCVLKQQVSIMTRELRKTKCELMKIQWQNKNKKRVVTKKSINKKGTSKKISIFFKPKPRKVCPMCQKEYSSSLEVHLNECLKEDDLGDDISLENRFKNSMCIF